MKVELTDIIDTLTQRINYHQEQLDKARTALEVIVNLGEISKPEPKPPMFTVKRTKPLSMDKPKKPATTKRGMVRVEIVRMLAKRDTIATKEITMAVYGDSPTMPQQKSVWNALTAMVKNREIVRVDPGVYAKPVKQPIVSEQKLKEDA